MLGKSVEILDVSLNVLWGAMVVVPDGQQTVDCSMVDLAETNVDSEDELDGEEDEEMDFCFQERPESSSVASRLWAATSGRRPCVSIRRFCGFWQILLQNLLALGNGEVLTS